MPHIKTAIREEVVTILSGTATAGNHVYIGPIQPTEQVNTPAIIVTTGDAQTHEEQSIGNSQTRQIQNICQVLAVCKNSTDPYQACDVQNVLDQVELEIEQALMADQTLGGLVLSIEFDGSTTNLESDSEYKSGQLLLQHNITFEVNRFNPEVEV